MGVILGEGMGFQTRNRIYHLLGPWIGNGTRGDKAEKSIKEV